MWRHVRALFFRYITLLHLRRVAQKQRWLRAHGSAEKQAAARFSWDMLNLEA